MSIELTNYDVELTFTMDVLGAVPKSKELYTQFVAHKISAAQAEEECLDVTETEEKGYTTFLMSDEQPYLRSHVIKGYFKDTVSSIRNAGSDVSSIKAFKKYTDGMVFPCALNGSEKLMLELSGPLTVLERPLRISGPQGERVCLTKSDVAPAGSKLRVRIKVLDGGFTRDMIEDILNYGQFRGLSQFRNAAYGQFTWEYLVEPYTTSIGGANGSSNFVPVEIKDVPKSKKKTKTMA